MAPQTVAEFGTLGLNDAGKRISVAVTVVEGMAYVNWLGSTSDQFSLNFSHENVALDPRDAFPCADFWTRSQEALGLQRCDRSAESFGQDGGREKKDSQL